ncbi:hypothetical protein KAW50_01335 [candidate division WOR-3 bacterium]|nr:hypothetical protein [candidate division WOR-3 bacterium]
MITEKSYNAMMNERQIINYITWDGKNDLGENVGSGIYFYKLKMGNKFSQTKELLLIK